MCGVVGYVGHREAHEVLLTNMEYLQQRGYESAGVAVMMADGNLESEKVIKDDRGPAPVTRLWASMAKQTFEGKIGIGHTRWTTHGTVSLANAHPHSDPMGRVWLVHNGQIDNVQDLKREFFPNAMFGGETDSELIAYLVEHFFCKGVSLREAVQQAVNHLSGTYALAVISPEEPDKIVCACLGSKLLVGLGKDECFIASDEEGIASFTNQVVDLRDNAKGGEVVGVSALGIKGGTYEPREIPWDISMASKKPYPHFMIKEIMDQPEAALHAVRDGERLDVSAGRVRLHGPEQFERRLREIEEVVLVGCGTAFHAAQLGERFLYEIGEVPRVRAFVASEFSTDRYLLDPRKTLLVAVSQSGTTFDTAKVVEQAKKLGILTCGVINRVESQIARMCDFGVYCHGGPEISVASTKAFISQTIVLYQLAVFMAQLRTGLGVSPVELKDLLTLPHLMRKTLAFDMNQDGEYLRGAPQWGYKKVIDPLLPHFSRARFVQFIGCGDSYIIDKEAALKFREITYVPSTGIQGGELKQG